MTLLALVVPTIASPRIAGAPPSDGITDPAALRLLDAADSAIARLSDEPTVVVLLSGPEPLVEDVSALDLPHGRIVVRGAPALVTAVSSRGQVPRVQSAALGGHAGLAAAAVHAARPAARFVGVTVPAGADPPALEGATAALSGALGPSGEVTLVVPGHLGVIDAPDPELEGLIFAALRDNDRAALTTLSAEHPRWANALAPLRLALGIVHGRGGRLEVSAVEVVDGHVHVAGIAG